jgi:hypothetical protein
MLKPRVLLLLSRPKVGGVVAHLVDVLAAASLAAVAPAAVAPAAASLAAVAPAAVAPAAVIEVKDPRPRHRKDHICCGTSVTLFYFKESPREPFPRSSLLWCWL